MGDLLPCPFCGGQAAAFNYIIEGAVNCMDCRATIARRHSAKADDGFEAAIAAWNRRPTPTAPAEDVRAGALKEGGD